MAFALENLVLDQTGCYWTCPWNCNSYENILTGIDNNVLDLINLLHVFIVRLAAKYYFICSRLQEVLGRLISILKTSYNLERR
jgi:hypothetical protein